MDEITLLQKISDNLDRIANNYPAREDIRFFNGDAETIAAGTTVTVTFTIRNDFELVLEKAYADVRDDCVYEWHYSEQIFDSNIIEFPHGRRMPATISTITLVITNSGATDWAIGFYIRGWARRLSYV